MINAKMYFGHMLTKTLPVEKYVNSPSFFFENKDSMHFILFNNNRPW